MRGLCERLLSKGLRPIDIATRGGCASQSSSGLDRSSTRPCPCPCPCPCRSPCPCPWPSSGSGPWVVPPSAAGRTGLPGSRPWPARMRFPVPLSRSGPPRRPKRAWPTGPASPAWRAWPASRPPSAPTGKSCPPSTGAASGCGPARHSTPSCTGRSRGGQRRHSPGCARRLSRSPERYPNRRHEPCASCPGRAWAPASWQFARRGSAERSGRRFARPPSCSRPWRPRTGAPQCRQA
mmetsp:Transcript_64084/g.162409  ORF Transcript_64084/g.162409 Transcript_64084/m.162409 type:complete len:236 (-) Transcript_64084:244-951(-)